MFRLAIAISFLLCVFTFAEDSPVKSESQALHEETDKIFSNLDTTVSPGCALSVMKDGQIAYRRGYGMADLDHGVPITSGTVFHVASVSKQFTDAAILLLVQEGKLSLDDEVRKYLPEVPDFGVPIRIRHLIYHTSGLRDQWELLGLAGWRYSLDLITDDDVMEVISQQKELNFPPGDQHIYCNTGYTLLAQIVKKVSGKSLREFTAERIFQPLGMKNTHFRDDHAEIVKNIAYGYENGDGENVYRLSVTNFDTVGATSLLTTVEDLAHWDENFYHPLVGSAALVQQQLQRGKLNSGKELDYAAGLVHGKYRGLETIDHGGADAGYRADLLRFPQQHFSVAILCNKAETNPGGLARKVADVYLQKEFKEPQAKKAEAAKSVSVPAAQLKKYAGLYWKKDDQSFLRVAAKDDKLFLSPSPDEQLELAPLSENRFQSVLYPVRFAFDQVPSGSAFLLRVEQGGDKPDTFEPATEAKPTPEELQAYTGVYGSDEIEMRYRIEVDDGGLVLKRSKSKPKKLDPATTDYFQGPDGTIHFQKDGSGKVTGFVLNAGRIRNFRFHKLGEVTKK